MQTSLSITTDHFHLYSHGKGTAYTLYNRISRSDLFIQGDDALDLDKEIRLFEDAGYSYDVMLSCFWTQLSGAFPTL
jgi:hypothetical protein